MKHLHLMSVTLTALILASCAKEAELKHREYPMVHTFLEQTNESITLKGELVSGEQEIISYGFVYDTNHFYSYHSSSDTIYLQGVPGDNYAVELHTGFKPGKTYTVAAFVKTHEFTFIGNKISFQFNNSKPVELEGFTPNRGTTDDLIVIHGKNFSSSKRGNIVIFGSDTATVEYASESSLTVRVPGVPDEQFCNITVTTPTSTATSNSEFERWYHWKRLPFTITDHQHQGEKCGDYFYLFNITLKYMVGINVQTGETRNCSPIPIPSSEYTYIDTWFNCNNKLYFLFKGLTDFWEYSPEQDTWNLKQPFPRIPDYYSYYTEPFVIDGKAYIGFKGGESRLFCEYDQLTNKWTIKKDFPEEVSHRSFSVSAGPIAYFGTGANIYRYNPVADEWQYLSEYPGNELYNLAGFYIKGKIYIGLGKSGWEEIVSTKLWSFDPAHNSWNESVSFPKHEDKERYLDLISSDDGYVVKHSFAETMQLFHFDPEREK